MLEKLISRGNIIQAIAFPSVDSLLRDGIDIVFMNFKPVHHIACMIGLITITNQRQYHPVRRQFPALARYVHDIRQI